MTNFRRGFVSEADHGWVIGVTTAVFCLAGGMMSLDIRLPFYFVTTAAVIGLILMLRSWGTAEIRELTGKFQV